MNAEVFQVNQAFDRASELMKELRISGNDVSIVAEHGTVISNASSISINGDKIIVNDPQMFAEMTSLASNFEIYRKTDDTIQFDMMFYDKN